MSYIRNKVYSFECDRIKVYSFGCDFPGCDVTNWDIEAEPDLRTAVKRLRTSDYWTVKGSKHYCPRHKRTDL